MGFRERFRSFMQGRYGTDEFSRFLSLSALVMLLAALIIKGVGAATAGSVIWWIALAVIIVSYYRMFSRNVSRRCAENVKFLALRDRIKGLSRREINHIKQLRTHRFFRCPGCSQRVRIPRGKGRIRIVCPKCGTAFVRRS